MKLYKLASSSLLNNWQVRTFTLLCSLIVILLSTSNARATSSKNVKILCSNIVSTAKEAVETQYHIKYNSPLNNKVYQDYIDTVFLSGKRMTLNKQERLEIESVIEHLVQEQQLQRALWLAREFQFKDKISAIEKDLVKILSESKVEDIEQLKYEPDPLFPNDSNLISGVYKLSLADGNKAIFKHNTEENNYRTNLKYDLATFIIDQRLNLNIVPYTIERSLLVPGVGLKKGIVTPFVENIPGGHSQVSPRVTFLDFLINNFDRDGFINNVLLTPEGWQAAIDHSSAFSFKKVYGRKVTKSTHSKLMLDEFLDSTSTYNPGPMTMEALQKYTIKQIKDDLSPYIEADIIPLIFERKWILEEYFIDQ